MVCQLMCRLEDPRGLELEAVVYNGGRPDDLVRMISVQQMYEERCEGSLIYSVLVEAVGSSRVELYCFDGAS